jgi:outer membrane receptor for ferrienterochelin and colicin
MVMEMKDGSGERMRVMAPGAGFEGLVVIDGQIVSESAFRALSPDRIEKIEVVKGPRAAEMYPGNAAATKGVIRITTKR